MRALAMSVRRYDLGISIAPLERTDHGRIRVVTFVQRFWLSNKLGMALEYEQWTPGATGGCAQPTGLN